MKSIKMSKMSLALASAMLVIPIGAVHGESAPIVQEQEVNNGEPYIEAYDAKGNLVKEYSEEEIKTLMEEAKESALLQEAPVTDGQPFAHFYDENNYIAGSSETNIMNAQQSALASVTALSTSSYSGATFNSNVWVGGGAYYYRPQSITVNPKQKFSAMVIKLYRQGTATAVGSVKIGNFTGGLNVPLSGYTKISGNYKIQFVNANTDGATIYLNGGTVYEL